MNYLKNVYKAEHDDVPAFVSKVLIGLGSWDFFRGIMHTVLLKFSLKNVAAVKGPMHEITDTLVTMGVLGASNFVSSAALILMGLRARHLGMLVMFCVPIAYYIATISVRMIMEKKSTGKWIGAYFMYCYWAVCWITVAIAAPKVRVQKNKRDE
jgi:hypothetical protein